MKNVRFLLAAILAISVFALSACSKTTPAPVAQDNVSTGTTIKMSDVAAHNSRTDCWTVIDGQVYDLTSYIASGQHKPVIVDGCGIDSTEMFNNVAKHSGKKAQDMLPGMSIGVLGK